MLCHSWGQQKGMECLLCAMWTAAGYEVPTTCGDCFRHWAFRSRQDKICVPKDSLTHWRIVIQRGEEKVEGMMTTRCLVGKRQKVLVASTYQSRDHRGKNSLAEGPFGHMHFLVCQSDVGT